jgi:hypothetical protein
MRRAAGRLCSTGSAFLVRLTKGKNILGGPSIGNSMIKILRALTFGSFVSYSTHRTLTWLQAVRYGNHLRSCYKHLRREPYASV